MIKNRRYFIKIIILFLALILAIILLISQKSHQKLSNQTTHFLVDISNSMNTKDIDSSTKKQNLVTSRLQAIKDLISQTIKTEPLETYSLIIFGDSIDFFIPPTQDTGLFIEYLNQVNTNLLPWWWTDVNQIWWMLHNFKPIDKIIIFSDFDYETSPKLSKEFLKLKRYNTYLIGLWSKLWWEVRYTDESILKKDLVSVTSKRNDKTWKYISKEINAKYKSIDSYNQISKLTKEITNSNHISFSSSQTQIIIGLLAVLIFIWL